MSDNIFNNLNVDTDFSVDDDFVSVLISFAIPNAIEDLSYYWRNEGNGAKKILNDKTFEFIWRSFPKHRDALFNFVLESASKGENDSGANHYLTKEFSTTFANKTLASIEENDDYKDNQLKAKIVSCGIHPKFDYLKQLHKFSIDPTKDKLYNLWERTGLRSSGDFEFYDFLLGRVKREKGATDKKNEIISHALENDCLSNKALKRVAKSSPKTLKRTVVCHLSNKLSVARRNMDHAANSNRGGGVDEVMVKYWKKNVDRLEAKAMMFVDCTDNEVVGNLIECLSKDNLPWLMPSASQHPWLARRLERKIE
jgi:hypothetical protein